MIVIQLVGGLGNQMFQYAAARRLAVEKQTVLKLDVSAFAHYTLRRYKLHHFHIDAEIASAEDLAGFTHPGLAGKLKRLLERRFLPRTQRHIYHEKLLYRLEPEFLQTPEDVYLHGYYQDATYFKPVEPLIRQELSIKTPPDAINRAIAEQIQQVNAVSLHIRRGDYASNAVTQQFHGLLPMEYYHSAVNRLAEIISAPHFFVFSDDPAWAAANLQIPYPMTFVKHNDADHDYEDLRLMTLCQHHIIANSSFSWWGAWLSTYPQKQVIAPRQWVKDPDVNTVDATPPEWHRL